MQVENPEDNQEQSAAEQAEKTAAMGKRKANDEQRDIHYQAYLLRCWREGDSWRYSVESAGNEQTRKGFGSLESLLAWLGEELIF